MVNSNGKLARRLIYQNVSRFADLRQMSVMAAYNHQSVQAARQLFGRRAVTAAAPAPCAECGYFQRYHGPAPGHLASKAAFRQLVAVGPARPQLGRVASGPG